MPKLVAAHYRLLQGEDCALTGAMSNETHDFGGELVLTFEDGRAEYVSWVSEPVQYSIGRQPFSYGVPGADLTDHDVSQTPMWSGLVGREVSLAYIQSDNQALQIASLDDRVLVCSYERGNWWSDELTICRELPSPYDAELLVQGENHRNGRRPLSSGARRMTSPDMEGIIYICGAIVFGIGYAFLKPMLSGPWLIAIAIAYFGLLRLTASAARHPARRRALDRSSNDKRE